MVLAPVWQHPYVSVFKICEVDTWKHVVKEGNVVAQLDKLIGKRVFNIVGTVPAANFVQFPKARNQSLGLNGRFLYLQVQVRPSKDWAIHIEAVDVADKVQRISLSNIYKEGADKKAASGQQIPMGHVTAKWSVIALDMHQIVAQDSMTPFKATKSIQFCANMRVRGAFSSSVKYTLETLPRELVLSAAVSASSFDFIWLPTEPDVVAVPAEAAAPSQRLEATAADLPRVQHGQVKSPLWEGQPHALADIPSLPPEDPRHSPQRDYDRNYPDRTPSPPAPPPPAPQSPLDDGPALELVRVNGFTGERTNALTWVPSGKETVFIASANIVAMDVASGQQRFFHGHTDNIVSFAFSGDGTLLATAQEGKQALIRVWQFSTARCLAVLCGHASGMICVDVSDDGRALLGVGLDAHSRQQITLWDISELPSSRKSKLVLKATTEYNIKRAKFSAYEPDKFMTVGRDSIRLYRVKNGSLRGLSVQVTDANKKLTAVPGGMAVTVGHDIFTDLAYERGAPSALLKDVHVYVASVSGAVYQVNYGAHKLEAVYQLHHGAINSITLNEGFAITGSDDKFLRVWPIDFTDYFLEAEHETPVTAVGVSPDGLQVCVGTENGSVGVLDISSHKYSTLLRSHSDAINSIAVDGSGAHCVTASSDGTIRIWDLSNFQQLFEFDAPGELVQSVACHPSQADVACGFSNGKLRVFHVPTTSLIQEHHLHRSGVCELAYSPNGERLFTLGQDAHLHVHDVLQLYLPLKVLPVSSAPMDRICMAVAPDGELLCTVSKAPNAKYASLLLFSGPSLKPDLRIDTESPGYARLAFSVDSRCVWAATTDNKLERYCCSTGKLLSIVDAGHRDQLLSLQLHPSNSYLCSGAHDKLLKVWDVTRSDKSDKRKQRAPHQTLIGHSAAVTAMVFVRDLLVTADAADCLFFWRCGQALTAAAPPDELNTSRPRLPALHELDAAGDAQEEHDQRRHPPPKPMPLASSDSSGTEQFAPVPADVRVGRVVPERASRSPSPAPESSNLAAPYGAMPALPPSSANSRLLQLGASRPVCDAIIGMAHDCRNAMVWLPPQGLLLYAVDNAVVVDDLKTRKQRYLVFNTQPITALASPGPHSPVVASASAKAKGSASATADICIWDITTSTCTAVLSYHPVAVHALAMSPDGAWLVSVGRDPERSVVLWDLSYGEAIAVGRTERASEAVAWRPSSGDPEFLTVGDDGALLWRLEPTHMTQHPVSIPEEARVAGCVAVYSASSGIDYIGDKAGSVWQLGPQPQGGAAFGRAISLPGEAVQVITQLGSRMVVATAGNTVHLYQEDQGAWSQLASVEVDGSILAMSFSDDLKEGVLCTSAATMWHVELGERKRVPLLSGHAAAVRSFAASPTDPALFASTCLDGLLRIWQIGTGDAIPLMEFESADGSSMGCCAAAFDPSGTAVLAGYSDGGLRVFDLEAVAIRWTITRHSSPVVGVRSNATGSLILTGSRDGAIAITDAHTAELRIHSKDLLDVLQGDPLDALDISGGEGSLTAVAWARGLAVFATPWADSSIRVLTRYTPPAPSHEVLEESGAVVSFLPTNQSCIAYSCPRLQGSVVIFDYRTSTVLRSVNLPQQVCSLAASPCSHSLVAGSGSASVFLIDADSVAWRELVGHMHAVQAVLFSNSGQTVLSAGGSTVLQWNAVLSDQPA